MKKSNEPTKIIEAMKKTMRFLSTAALALVGVVMMGCSGDDSLTGKAQEPAVKNNVVTLTTTVNLGGDGTRALTNEGVKTFAAGDKIAVIYQNTSGETVKAESEALTEGGGSSATFTVTLTAPMTSSAVRYIYPAAMAAATVATSTAVTDDATINYAALASQDGTLTTLASKYDLAVFDGSLTADATLPASSTLTNRLAVIAYTIKDNTATPNDLTGTIKEMTLSDGTNSYTVTRSAATGPIYVAIRPTTSATIKYTADDGTNWYVKSVTGKTYAASNIYQQGLKMIKIVAVDLGLSVRWASMNVGATSVTDYGDYFAWGETEPYYSSQDPLMWKDGKTNGYADDWSSYQFTTDGGSSFTKYNGTDNKQTLDLEDDAARANWGSDWRMPTYTELKELADTYNTDANDNSKTHLWEWKENYNDSGNNGYLITCRANNNSIFLPAAGNRGGTSLDNQGLRGRYWSSTLGGGKSSNRAWSLDFTSGTPSMDSDSRRYRGFTVRAVQ